MSNSTSWFDVDRKGLGKLLERRCGKSFIVYELLQNAWDENSTEVDVVLTPIPGRPAYHLVVTDDNPDGFKDIRHAYTLFAESPKKDNAEQRGRFDIGEKLVLATCLDATISTTTGTVNFNEDGSRKIGRKKRDAGSVFEATVRMTREEAEQVAIDVLKLIPPEGIVTRFNAQPLKTRNPRIKLYGSLPTEIADENGYLKRTRRRTEIRVHRVLDGETAHIYEMGIPVVETDCDYHIEVMQKVPTNFERDSVAPSYVQKLRVLMLNSMYPEIKEKDQASRKWVRDAIESPDVSDAAIRRVVTTSYGDKAVINDLSDRESTDNAASKGYAVIQGGAYSKQTWENIKRSAVVKPAGQVPAVAVPKPYSPDGEPLTVIPRDELTDGMKKFERLAHVVSKHLLGFKATVVFADQYDWGYSGTYGNRTLTVNVASSSFGRKAFLEAKMLSRFFNFLVHEYSHQFESNHFSERYHKACTRLAGLLAVAMYEHRDDFAEFFEEGL